MNSVPDEDLTAPHAATPPTLANERAHTPANDDAADDTPATRHNPLWIIAIGMACFAIVTVAVML
jgi:hypothetical protein